MELVRSLLYIVSALNIAFKWFGIFSYLLSYLIDLLVQVPGIWVQCWRGKSSPYQKNRYCTRSSQGEMVVARFEQWPPAELPGGDFYGSLLFGDGSQKMLAAMTCWIALLMVWRGHGEDSVSHPSTLTMIASFLRITTMVKATEARGTALDGVINRIVQQNIAAKVQPITSFSWASILKAFGTNSFDDALTAYNGHPDVIAHDRNDSGAGSISLDGRKKQAVRNWMDRTCPKAFDEVLRSTHDLPFNLGPFGEAFALSGSCFLGSKANLEAFPDSVDGPCPNEAFWEVTWHIVHLHNLTIMLLILFCPFSCF